MEALKRYRLWAIVVSCCMIVLGAALAGLIWWLGLSPVLILAAGAGAGIVWELSIAKKSKQ